MSDPVIAHFDALVLLQKEIGKQDDMWGKANERIDVSGGELLRAAIAQLSIAVGRSEGVPEDEYMAVAREAYPADWSGLRNYSPEGSNVANLVVAAAFIFQEIKRRILAGESTERLARRADQPYAEASSPNPA